MREMPESVLAKLKKQKAVEEEDNEDLDVIFSQMALEAADRRERSPSPTRMSPPPSEPNLGDTISVVAARLARAQRQLKAVSVDTCFRFDDLSRVVYGDANNSDAASLSSSPSSYSDQFSPSLTQPEFDMEALTIKRKQFRARREAGEELAAAVREVDLSLAAEERALLGRVKRLENNAAATFKKMCEK